jgi:hypothetical protein
MINGIDDALILAARLLLATLFLIFGWRKLRDLSGTVSQMVQLGLPTPVLAAFVSIIMDPSFIAPGAEAFERDLADAESSTPATSPWTRRTTRSRVSFLRSWPNIPSDRSVDYSTRLSTLCPPSPNRSPP